VAGGYIGGERRPVVRAASRMLREEKMQEPSVRITDVDSRRLQHLIEGTRHRDLREASSVDRLERHLDDADVTPAAHIDPDVVTMNSEAVVTDLGSGETLTFRLVFPRRADAAAGRISVLAPLGMAVLGRRAGEHIVWRVPGGVRHLRVDHVLYQPEREGSDIT
jgi:regulator of nucleoside diphosphate kinase